MIKNNIAHTNNNNAMHVYLALW